MYIINKEVEKMEKMRIKNNRKNKIYLIIGRITTYIFLYGISINISLKILLYIVNNCITTL